VVSFREKKKELRLEEQ